MENTTLGLTPPGLSKARQDVVDVLTEAYANDEITVEEFEKRVSLAQEVDDEILLSTIIADIHSSESSLSRQVKASNQLMLARQEKSKNLVSFFSRVERTGPWSPAKKNRVFSITGNTVLDLRDAFLPPGLTTIRVFGLMSEIKIIAPQGLNIECEGNGILGDFAFHPSSTIQNQNDAPIVRIKGLVLLGKVSVTIAPPNNQPKALVEKVKTWVKDQLR